MYLSERALKLAYAASWPARLWSWIPGALEVQRVEQDLPLGVPRPGRPPLRIGFVSDLHLGPTTPVRLVENAFAQLREARLDVLALGGDYVFLGASHARMEKLERLVASVPARTKVAVLGNHDFWARPERVVDALTRGGAHVLLDQGLVLPPPHDDVGLIGLDDPLTSRKLFDAEAARAGVDRALGALPEGVSSVIAVAHSPDTLPALLGRGVSLLLCGHTHGGQVALPGYRWVVMPSRVGRRYPYGLHRLEDGLTLFVSRGLGTSMVPLRTWAPEDLAVFSVG
jgi:predicted MPP superfamily phosphohydrolase